MVTSKHTERTCWIGPIVFMLTMAPVTWRRCKHGVSRVPQTEVVGWAMSGRRDVSGCSSPAGVKKSDAELVREGALALAAAHGEKPRYGGKFLSAGNEEIPSMICIRPRLAGIHRGGSPCLQLPGP